MKAANVRVCRSANEPAACLGVDWYDACLDSIDALERQARRHGNLEAAFTPWCELCAAVGEALNDDAAMIACDDVDYVNASPIARWLLRRLDRRFG